MPSSSSTIEFGATPIDDDRTRFAVWAPKAKQTHVHISRLEDGNESFDRSVELSKDADGVYLGIVDDCPVGTLYRYQLDYGSPRPDPYSRFQPLGVHGPSQVIDPNAYKWTDDNWRGVQKSDLIIYELHVGSLTSAGTYQAAIGKLDELVELGVTAIELLPLSQTPGKWNWGYDGVNYFAPRNTFGCPNELKSLVDACHHRGLAVILDVVYNHVGPEGNYLNGFGPYRSRKFGTPWGDSLNFSGRGNKFVRDFVLSNVIFWLEEYRFDGLRLDAIHYMFDDSGFHIVDEIQQRFREFEATQSRQLHLIAEANIYDNELVGNARNGRPNYDAIWSDCLMHSIYAKGCPDIRLTNRRYEASDLAVALQYGYVFSAPDATRVDESIRQNHHPDGDRNYVQSLIMALQTHDSVGNHPHGKRLHQLTSFHFQKAAAPLILLYPSIPMIFMGEEWASDAPFPFFADFEDDRLRKAVDKGRRDEYPHHDWSDSPLPSDPSAFMSTKSQVADQKLEMWDWYQQLLTFRKRGVAEGWLNLNNWTTDVLPNNCFTHIFETQHKRIHVCCRLAAECSDPTTLVLTNEVEFLFDSRCTKMTKASRIDLLAQHCCIWSSI